MSSPGDSSEREAVATARRVMGIGALLPSAAIRRSVSTRLAPTPPLVAPAGSAGAPQPGAAANDAAELGAATAGGGEPLPAELARFMRARFRADFSAVRLHTGARAAALSDRLGARAFTYGRNIFFNTGQFRPGSREGLELIAHELTHTLQPGAAIRRAPLPATTGAVKSTGNMTPKKPAEKSFTEKAMEAFIARFAPRLLPYLKKAGPYFRPILLRLEQFLRNFIAAGRQALVQFARNFPRHLLGGVVGWLTGQLAGSGLYVPKAFTNQEFIRFGLSALGISWEAIRPKVLKALGRKDGETILRTAEAASGEIAALSKGNFGAMAEKLWSVIANFEQLSFTEILFSLVRDVIIAGLLRFATWAFPPLGAVVNIVLAVYNTIMFVWERFDQIREVARAYVESIQEIAAGRIAVAADRIETTMAGVLPLVISLLMRLLGLGRFAKRFVRIFKKIRGPIDKGITALVKRLAPIALKIWKKAQDAIEAAKKLAAKLFPWFKRDAKVTLADGEVHCLSFEGSARWTQLMLASANKKPVQSHIRTAIKDPKLDPKARAAAARALKFYEENFGLISGKSVAAKPKPEVQAQIDAVPANLVKLGAEVQHIAGDPSPTPPPKFIYRAPFSASALGLPENPRPGTKADRGRPEGWPLIVSRGLSKNSAWVRMHLISAAFGGLDDDRNLLPAPNAVNGKVQAFENVIKARLEIRDSSGAPTKAKSLWRKPNKPVRGIWMEAKTTGWCTATIDPESGKPLHHSRTFATKVYFSAGECRLRQGAWTKITTPAFEKEVGVDPPKFAGTKIASILEVSPESFAIITGLRTGAKPLHRSIVQRGPFKDLADFVARITPTDKGEITEERKAALASVVQAIKARLLRLEK